MTEKAPMRVLLRARDTESDDDELPDGDASENEQYRPKPKPLLRMRCFACAGTGNLWIVDSISPSGRYARCVACCGTGRVEVK
jgi:hypothetical protein